MKHLAVMHGDKILFDGEVAEITWTESDNQITLKATMKKGAGGSGGVNLLADILGAAAKRPPVKQEAQQQSD